MPHTRTEVGAAWCQLSLGDYTRHAFLDGNDPPTAASVQSGPFLSTARDALFSAHARRATRGSPRTTQRKRSLFGTRRDTLSDLRCSRFATFLYSFSAPRPICGSLLCARCRGNEPHNTKSFICAAADRRRQYVAFGGCLFETQHTVERNASSV